MTAFAIAAELLAREADSLRGYDPQDRRGIRLDAVNAERRLISAMKAAADTTSLGHGRMFALADLQVEIGIHRVNPFFRGSPYFRDPRGELTIKTLARGKVKAERTLSAKTLRDLGAALIGYADVLEGWQAEEEALAAKATTIEGPACWSSSHGHDYPGPWTEACKAAELAAFEEEMSRA